MELFQKPEPAKPRKTATALRPATAALNGGLVPNSVTGAIQPDISMSVNNVFAPGSAGFSAEGADLADLPFLYARWTNPTTRALEARLAALEGAEDALTTATGVAAIAATFLGLLKSGDHLIVSEVCYAGAFELATRILPDLGIQVTPVNLADLEATRAALRPNTRLIHAESPCNPILRLTDLAALATLAHEAGALLSVDSTLATPVITRPLDLGVDLVIHSLTKFMNGHGDALGGAVIGRKELISALRARSGVYLGATLAAQNAWLILRGLDTLFPRIRTASANAQRLAGWLEDHPSDPRDLSRPAQPPAIRAGPRPNGPARRHDRLSDRRPAGHVAPIGRPAADHPLCLFLGSPAVHLRADSDGGYPDLDLPDARSRPCALSRLGG